MELRLPLRPMLTLSLALLHSLIVIAFPNRLTSRQYDATAIVVNESLHDVQFHKFFSRPDIDAPKWEIKVHNGKKLADGYWFLAAYGQVEQENNDEAYVAPYIYDQRGELVWSGAQMFDNFGVFDFKISKVEEKDLLSMIYPSDMAVWMLDDRYEIVKALQVGRDDDPLLLGKKTVNIHDFQVTSGNDFIVLNRKQEWASPWQMRSTGYDGACKLDMNGFQRISGDDGALIWEWSPEEYISLNQSRVKPNKKCETDGWDYAHLNSVDPLPDGNYLLSARHVNAIFKISGEDGHVIWQLGGMDSAFTWADDGHFMGQHDARFISQNDTHMLISMMDNAIGPWRPKTNNPCSRGLVLALDLESMTVSEVIHYDHPQGGYATGRGNMQTLPNGNAFVGYSDSAFHAEFTADSELLMEAFLPCGVKTYRAYKFPWTGNPQTPPDVYSVATSDVDTSVSTNVYVSWNGATEVASWTVYNTSRNGDVVEAIATANKTSFETRLVFEGYAPFVLVEALDKDGSVLGASNITKTADFTGLQHKGSHDEVANEADDSKDGSHDDGLDDGDDIAAADAPDHTTSEQNASEEREEWISADFVWGFCAAVVLIVLVFSGFYVARRSGDGDWPRWARNMQLYKLLHQREYYNDEEDDFKIEIEGDDEDAGEDSVGDEKFR